jgi:hypothetical protein
MGKTNYFFTTLPFSPWAVSAMCMASCRSSSKNTGKMSLIPIFNKNSPRAHTESELDVLGPSSQKACEICSSLVQKKKLKKKYLSSHKLPKQQSTSFWSQGILGVNLIIYSCNLRLLIQ